jgi:hypothetical protein
MELTDMLALTALAALCWLHGQPFVATLFLPIAVVATAVCVLSVHMDEIVHKGMYIIQ